MTDSLVINSEAALMQAYRTLDAQFREHLVHQPRAVYSAFGGAA